ncbi:MAG TPA: alkaline phosphatase family protein, partial [Fimbriimonadaceae bacterium]|nr:alkaline phosphatase family protein [Fimbriimonadaceae bacterium]
MLASSLAFAIALGLQGPPRKVVLVSWDGAADWVVDRLLAENKLPNLARMAKQGAAAEHMLAVFPSKT